VEGYQAVATNGFGGRETTNVHVGIATGQWQTIAEYDGGREFVSNKDIVFSGPIESKNGTTIAVRGEWGFDGARRIIAIDKEGNIHGGGWCGRSTGLKTLATTEFYNLKPEHIQKYQLQFRPYQWVTFKNVSLQPGVKTNVQVEIKEAIPKAEPTHSSGYGGGGVYGGGPQWVPSDWPGGPKENNYALQFNGMYDYVKIPSNPSLDIRGSLTLSAWVKNNGDNDGQIIWRGDNQGGRDPYELHITNERMEFRIDAGKGISYRVRSNEKVDNVGHFWTGVYDKQANKIHLYRDGILENSADIDKEIEYDTSSMWNIIGAVDFGNWQHFRGVIDEVRIWNIARTQEQIKQDMSRSLHGDEANLVAYWKFDEGIECTLRDLSANHNDGQLNSWKGRTGYISPSVNPDVQIETEKSNGAKGKVVDGIDITPANFDVRLNQERGVCDLVVSIQNESSVTIPKFKLKFYRGNPSDNLDEAGNVHSGWHEAGPIEPSKRWNESTRDFHLPDGQYELNVFLDFDNSVSEIDENNNQAVLQVRIENGQIVQKSLKFESIIDKGAKIETLQSLVDSTKPGDTVTVPNGLYTEPIDINKPLILRGESRTQCVFEITANRPVIFIDTKGKGRVVVENLTIKWQLATSDKGIERPFALGVKDTEAEIKNCSFLPLGNFTRSPVAVRADGFSNLTINNSQFEGFEYVICYGEGTKGLTKDCLIMNCGHQGIINYSGSTLRVERNIITGSKYHAIRCTGGTLYVKDNLIINNDNRGIYLGNKSGNGTITNNLIMGNGTGIGGFTQSKYEIEHNIIADSSYAGIGMEKSCSLKIRDNIFVDNERGWIMFDRGSKGANTCYRNTFWQNKVDAENYDKTENSINENPGFMEPDEGDFSLRPGPAMEHKQGLTNPQVIKSIWEKWKDRTDKNTL